MIDNTDEVLDVVDKGNNVIGREKRGIVHATGLWHRAAYVFLFDRTGRVFIQRRAETKTLCHGVWDLSAAEHVGAGESYEEAAVRGVREELGAGSTDLRRIGEYRHTLKYGGKTDNEMNRVFTARIKGDIKLDTGEVQEGKWVSLQELTDMVKNSLEMFTPWLMGCIKFLEGRNGNNRA